MAEEAEADSAEAEPLDIGFEEDAETGSSEEPPEESSEESTPLEEDFGEATYSSADLDIVEEEGAGEESAEMSDEESASGEESGEAPSEET